MKKYILKRLVQIIILLYIYASIVFLIFYAMPGDVTNKFAMNPDIPPEARMALRKQLGLDQPLPIQYLTFMKNLFIEGQMGRSFNHYPRPVWDIIMTRWPRTIVLFLSAILIYYYIGFTLGKVIAWRRGGVLEYGATITGIGLWTVFTPWWALLLIWFLAFKLGLFPINQFLTPDTWIHAQASANFVFSRMIFTGIFAAAFLLLAYLLSRRFINHVGKRKLVNGALAVVTVGTAVGIWGSSGLGYLAGDILWHMGIPIITLATIGFGGSMLLMRDSMLETIKEDYITTAKAKGLPDKVVRDKHAARTALLPIVTSFVLAIPFAIDGAVIIETVFSWQGIGMTLVEAVSTQDYPLAVGAYTFFGMFALLAHLIADILYAFLDPRVSYGKGAAPKGV